MTSNEIKSLLDDAKCVNNCVPAGFQLALLIALIWDGIENGGFGSGGGAPDYIAYAGPPTDNPPTLAHIVVDVNGQQWMFWNNTWN